MRGVVRYVCAMVMMMYGFAKLNESQFTMLDSELDKPMRMVSGFWVVWHFFGYSKVYGNLIGVVQVVGALLLTMRRTALLGACMLAPILVNIVLVDYYFGVDRGAMWTAVVMLVGMMVVIWPHLAELKAMFWREAGGERLWWLRVLMLVVAFGFTYWVANYNNRAPTPIDGAWVRVEGPWDRPGEKPDKLFFEHNRAHLLVYKDQNGKYLEHHFEVDAGQQKVSVWERWLEKGASLFEGKYRLDGEELVIAGKWLNASAVEWHFRRQ
jgi:hypothetical protein